MGLYHICWQKVISYGCWAFVNSGTMFWTFSCRPIEKIEESRRGMRVGRGVLGLNINFRMEPNFCSL
jgi:hypothetical protein